MNALEIAREQLKAWQEGRPWACVTIAETQGTVSRSEGKMLVFADGSFLGTVGGGERERLAILDAQECLRQGRGALKSYGEYTPGQEGSGSITVLIEVSPRLPQLVVVGGGHVGGAVLKLGKFLGYETLLLDDRDESIIGGSIALADRFVKITDYTADLRQLLLPEDAFVVLCGYNHAVDAAALAGVLGRPCAYLGMLGSRKKIAAIREKLLAAGADPEELACVRTPIGLDLGGETPEEVAYSILAEIQAVRYGRSGEPIARPKEVRL